MKKISKLNIIAIVTIGIILLIIPISIQANGRDSSKRINKYVALGDEVASESKDYYDVSYVSLIKDFLKALNSDLAYSNLSMEGITSAELLDIIKLNKEEIKDANLITISIGGNNILNVIMNNLYSNIDSESLEEYDEEMFEAIVSEYLNSDEKNLEVINEIEVFEKDFTNIIKQIKKLSPDADVYINTVYNPINKKGDIYDYFNEKISAINEVITKNYSIYDYKVIDCYNILNSDEKLNFHVVNNEFKIYPNKVGHAMMATQVISEYEDYVNLEVEKVTTSSNNIKGKTIPSSNVIVVSENGTVGTTQAKKNGEFEIEISPMVSGTNLEVLVYDNNIFSILYKFQKLVVKKGLFTS